jgi:hypothetical protein
MKIRRLHILLMLLALCVGLIPFQTQLRRPVAAATQILKGKKTVADRVVQFGDAVRTRLTPRFDRVAVPYPPQKMTLVGLKAEKLLEVWVCGPDSRWRHLKDYPILGMSGGLGPKLREGDMQVPEGLYRLESLNPNSLYHLALRVNYPNAEDRENGKRDGRTELGSDIMIHGNTCSIGCLAMGDEAAEDLFVLAAHTGVDNVSIILSPVDFRVRSLPDSMPAVPAWTAPLYGRIKEELAGLEDQAPTIQSAAGER